MSLFNWLRSHATIGKSRRRLTRSLKQRGLRMTRKCLRLELLEDRRVLAALMVTSASDDGPGSLREAIVFANTMTDADEINFDASVFATPQTIVLTTGQLTITNPLTINGPGANQLAVSGNQSSRVFQIGTAAVASISGITIRDGISASNFYPYYNGGGGILNFGTLRLSQCVFTNNNVPADGPGGAIYNTLSLTVENCDFSNNTGGVGGAIYSFGVGIEAPLVITTISRSRFSNNTAREGGAIFVASIVNFNQSYLSTLMVIDCVFSNNSAGSSGGGIAVFGTEATIANSTFSTNSAKNGGAIFAGARLTMALTNCTVVGNSASESGGGISINGGALTLSNCAINWNTANVNGGAIYGPASVTGSTLSHNSAFNGGAIYGGASLSGSNIFSNTAINHGGGISAEGRLIVDGSTISGNSAGDGGGIWATGDYLTMTNSTLAGNSAAFSGGAIWGDFHTNPLGFSIGRSTLTNVTIAANQCDTSYNGGQGGGIFIAPTSKLLLVLQNTLVAKNVKGGGVADDIFGTLDIASAYNLIGEGGSGGIVDRSIDPLRGNQTGVSDPGLGQLGDNGGSTPTIPLLPGSPAVAGGNKGLAVNPLQQTVLTTDQRGNPRFYNGTVDIGAFQSQLAPARVTFIVSNTNDSGPGSLRDYVEANNLLGGGNRIEFALPAYSSIILSSGALGVFQDVNISGPGVDQLSLSGNHASRVFTIRGSTRSYKGVPSTISGVSIVDSFAGGLQHGGGLYQEGGALNIVDCLFNGNTADYGGAIYSKLGTISVSNSTFRDNRATSGGAVYNAPGSRLTIINSNFSSNSAEAGGGLYAASVVFVNGSSFVNNSASGQGGGIAGFGTSIIIANSTFSGNTANTGGGIDSRGVNFSITRLINVTLAGNGAAIGGGVYSLNRFSLNNTIVAKNTAQSGPDIYGMVFSSGHDLVGDSTDSEVTGLLNNLIGTAENPIDPLLAPLGYYGSATLTQPLLPGSPAINAGDNSLLSISPSVFGGPLNYDQRGASYDRVINDTVDIGAFESDPSQTSQIEVSISGALDGFQGVSGQMRTFALTAYDPLLSAPADIIAYAVDWGDGSPLQSYPAVAAATPIQHEFPTAGIFTISVTAFDTSARNSLPVTRDVTILESEPQGTVFAVGGISLSDDIFTLTQLTNTTAKFAVNAINLGTFDKGVYSDGLRFYGGTGYDVVVVNGLTTADQFTVTENSVVLNGMLLQGEDAEEWDINGRGGDDKFMILSGTPWIDGGAGADTIVAPDAANIWTITAANTGTLNGYAFIRVENLTGGNDDDEFQYVDTGSLGGKIDGGLGINTLDYSQRPSTANVNLLNQTASGASGGIANLQILIGSQASNDTLTATAINNTWTINDTNAGDLNGLITFNGFESLVGGSANDNFLLQSDGSIGSINGGVGTDSLDYSAVSKPVTVDLRTVRSATGVGTFSSIEQLVGGSNGEDTLQGANATNNWAINGMNSGSVGAITFSGFETIAGGSISDTFNFSSGTGRVAVVHGGTGVDTLIGAAAASNWVINDLGSGTLNTIPFDGIEKLTGGAGNDQFVIKANGDLAGIINGGGGSDTMDLTALTGPRTIDLGLKTVSGLLATFASIQTILMPSRVLNTLVGPSANSSWSITGANQVSVAGVQLVGVGNLRGSTLNDTFTFSSAGAIDGNIDGGLGTNTLVGAPMNNQWTISGNSSGMLNTWAFQNISNLTGSTAVDTFAFAPNSQVTGVLNGGGGSDVMSLVALSGPVVVDLQAKSVLGSVGSFTSIGSFFGSASSNDILKGPDTNTTWTIAGSNAGSVGTIDFSGFESIQGGTGNDVIKMGASADLTGAIQGGAGSDTLVGATQSNIWNVTGTGSGSLNGLAFGDIENLTGSSAPDWFEIGPLGSITGNLNGGIGNNNTLSYANWLTGVSVNLANNSASQVGSAVTNFSIVIGGNGDDTLIGNATRSSILIGNAGIDTLTGGSARDILVGGMGADRLNGGGGDDILIAGGTIYDSNADALLAILAEWNSSRAYATRVGNLKGSINVGPRLNGNYILAGSGLLPDPSSVDVLAGDLGRDWFIAGNEDIISDLVSTGGGLEIVDRV